MARPKTEAADYKSITWRLPNDVLQDLREAASEETRPINSQLILWLREMSATHKQRKHDHLRQGAAR